MVQYSSDEEIKKAVYDFFESLQDGEDYDEGDKNMVVQCVMHRDFRENMAGASNPWLRDLMCEYDTWIVTYQRKRKIGNFLKS